MTASDTFPGWPRVEAYLLECLADGDDAKLSAPDVMVVLGEMARIKGLLDEAGAVARQVAAGDGCWGSEQGYLPCTFRGLERVLEPSLRRRRRWPWGRR